MHPQLVEGCSQRQMGARRDGRPRGIDCANCTLGREMHSVRTTGGTTMRTTIWLMAAALTAAVLQSACGGEDPKVAAAAAVTRGDAFFQKGKYQEASLEYRKAVQLDGKAGEVRAK